VEVVNRRSVVDDDRVRAGKEALDVLAVRPVERDVEQIGRASCRERV